MGIFRRKVIIDEEDGGSRAAQEREATAALLLGHLKVKKLVLCARWKIASSERKLCCMADGRWGKSLDLERETDAYDRVGCFVHIDASRLGRTATFVTARSVLDIFEE